MSYRNCLKTFCLSLLIFLISNVADVIAKPRLMPDDAMARVFSSIEATLAELNAGPLHEHSVAREHLKDISSSLEALRRIVPVAQSATAAIYLEALEMDLKLLQMVSTEKGLERQLAKLFEVRSSLELKVSFAASAKGGELRLIQLVISTVKNDKEVSNYEVWYVPKGWNEVEDKYRRFDDLSTPSIKDLAPGNYIIWLQLSGVHASERTPITLGDDGKSKRRMTIVVR